MTRISLKHAALAICLVFSLFLSSARAQNGCMLKDDSSIPGEALAGNRGDNIDGALLTDGAELSRLFGVDPAIFYLRESGGPNAYATQSRFPSLLAAEQRPYCCSDGTVLIGLNLIDSEEEATGGSGQSIPAILAHEYAHIAQYKYGFPYEGKWRELHADYMAGWYIGHRLRFVKTDVYQAAANFFYKGDTNFNSPSHHGTHQERWEAFWAGLNLNLRGNVASGGLAYQYGVAYIRAKAE
jgi:hypothetical protein